MSLFYKISIDLVNANYIAGWCFHRFERKRPVDLELYLGDTLIGETTADRFREDLRELGIHPNGNCGFELVIDPRWAPAPSRPLLLRVKGSSVPLAEVDTAGTVGGKDRRPVDRIRSLLRFRRSGPVPLIFMHVPKTAGTSFNTLVRSLLPGDRVVSHLELVDREAYRRLQSRCRYLSGHLRVGVLKESFDLDRAELYTIVREPYAHLHSHLKWLIKTSADESDNYFKYSNRTIYRLGERLARTGFTDSDELARFAAQISGVEAAFFDNLQTRYFLDHEPARVCAADLEQAIANTRLFRLIGRTEDYFSFVDRFNQLNGLPKRAPTDRLNRSRSEPLFDIRDERLRAALFPLVRFDCALYEHIGRIWQQD